MSAKRLGSSVLAITTMGHTRSRYFGPSNGGLIFNSPLDTSVFRIDHDQAFQQTTHFQYELPKNGPWFAFTWHYDSGLAAGAVPDLDAALSLTGAQQAAIDFFCGESNGNARLADSGVRFFDAWRDSLGVGTENLFRTEHVRTVARFTVVNLTNSVALYNFLSTFSGTHFVTPRAYQAEAGIVF